MITALASFALLLLFVSACALIYYHLLPSGAVSAAAKSALSCLMLLCVFTPVFSFMKVELPSPEPSLPVFSEDTAFLSREIRQTLLSLIDPTVKKYTDVSYDFSADVNISDAGDINITVVQIIFDAEFDGREDLTRELIDLLGIVPETGVK